MTALERAAFAERCREIGSRGFKAWARGAGTETSWWLMS